MKTIPGGLLFSAGGLSPPKVSGHPPIGVYYIIVFVYYDTEYYFWGPHDKVPINKSLYVYGTVTDVNIIILSMKRFERFEWFGNSRCLYAYIGVPIFRLYFHFFFLSLETQHVRLPGIGIHTEGIQNTTLSYTVVYIVAIRYTL